MHTRTYHVHDISPRLQRNALEDGEERWEDPIKPSVAKQELRQKRRRAHDAVTAKPLIAVGIVVGAAPAVCGTGVGPK